MFNSWFTQNTSSKIHSEMTFNNHAVLGTSITAPLMNNEEEAFFACGCFWGAEKGFWKLPGVITTAVGYAGGSKKEPTYNQVCTGRTGHTEIVKATWNPDILGFSDLLKLFWECHNPTQGNRQGNDRGSQYRSAIYTTNKVQKDLSMASLNSYQKLLTANGFGKITTEIKENEKFYYAEEYHQQYLAKPGSRPYCSAMPTKVSLGDFPGCCYKLKKEVWSFYDWSISHCVLRSDNNQIIV